MYYRKKLARSLYWKIVAPGIAIDDFLCSLPNLIAIFTQKSDIFPRTSVESDRLFYETIDITDCYLLLRLVFFEWTKKGTYLAAIVEFIFEVTNLLNIIAAEMAVYFLHNAKTRSENKNGDFRSECIQSRCNERKTAKSCL